MLAGGHPGRVVTLTPRGAAALDALVGTGRGDPATRALAGRLVATGMAHPRPPDPPAPGTPTVTVVVPVFGRPAALARCLDALGTRHPVVVVDDGSPDPGSVADVCAAGGAVLVRRSGNGGPGEARNEVLGLVGTELVAFVDSDCAAGDGWVDDLTWHFADPDLAAVAPRVVAAPPPVGSGRRAVDRFGAAHSPLDLGAEAGEVGPTRAVRYVPTAALVVRRTALAAVGGFAPGMRIGEDVDLVWRLVDAGWRVRFDPSVTVAHAEPSRWRDVLARRFRYGTSAGPLAARHPGRLAPVELRPWPTAAALAAAGRTAGGGGGGRRRVGVGTVPVGPAPRRPVPTGLDVERPGRRLDGGRTRPGGDGAGRAGGGARGRPRRQGGPRRPRPAPRPADGGVGA